ncbi:Predicted metal-binding protein [Caloramator fervidus]|uniref:Predicted metal-binding protein n=1 Tax=Caloramator fervidus TaxID=29344 RepID=A0A1H5U7H6_9CLOT|nr:DUF2284 domain-containing protein [Caloramator fervidus]SEF70291.1 Predicted metal-binding protein [Caloramator fervidus]
MHKINIQFNNNFIELKFCEFKYDDLIIDVEKVRNLCKEGCPNYGINGGCPPFSPTADILLKNKKFILLIAKTKTKNFSKERFAKTDTTLNKFLKGIGKYFKQKYAVEFLSPEHCTECKNCTIKEGCQNKDKRTISITGTGIVLSEVIEKLFNEKLEWAKEKSPEKLIKIMCIISDKFTEKILSDLQNVPCETFFVIK